METREISRSIIRLSELISRMDGKLDGLVTHENQAVKLTDLRRELRGELQDVIADQARRLDNARTDVEATRDERLKAFKAEVMAEAKAEVHRALTSEIENQDKNMKRARLALWTGGGIGGVSGLLAVLNVFGG